MNCAIGNDLVFIPGIKKNLTAAFKRRVYTRREIRQIEEYKANPLIRYATTWAAKEAVVKALRQLSGGRLGLKWKDIEIVRKGKIPAVVLRGPRFKGLSFSLSLTHARDYAFAVVAVSRNIIN